MESMDGRRGATVGLVLAAMVGMVGCTPTADAERDASPAPSATTTATPDPAAAETLPIPVDEIPDWAKTVVQGSDTDGYVGSLSGWLSEPSSAHYRSQFSSLEPGTYQAQIACRGEGTISASGSDLDAERSPNPTQCTNATIAFDITTTSTGLKVDLDLQGDPSIFAVSLRRVA